MPRCVVTHAKPVKTRSRRGANANVRVLGFPGPRCYRIVFHLHPPVSFPLGRTLALLRFLIPLVKCFIFRLCTKIQKSVSYVEGIVSPKSPYSIKSLITHKAITDDLTPSCPSRCCSVTRHRTGDRQWTDEQK